MEQTGRVDDEDIRADAALWQAFKETGSASARERLFAHFAGFAKAIARRHHARHSCGDIELADLTQLGYAGLLEAIDHYDPQRGVPFRAFAAYRISGSIRDGMAKMSEVREQISSRAKLRRERMRSLSESDDPQVSAMEKLTEIAVGLALGFMLEGTGLYAQEADGAAGSGQGTAYDGAAWRETVAHLSAEIKALPEREQTILRHHYVEGVSFEHIAALLGVTKGRVSQIHRAALMLLRKRMRGRGHFRLNE